MLNIKIQIISIFLIVFTCIISGCLEETPNEKKQMTVYVDMNGDEDFISIQDGIDYVSPGGTVFVKSGLYNEILLINKSINLIGEGRDQTIISCIIENNLHISSIIFVNADNCNIEGFNITCKYFSSGITGIFINSSFNNITNNFINNYNYGIYINTNLKNNNILDNIVLNSKHGLEIYGSNNNNIINNKISLSSVYGLYLHGSNNNIIINNHVSRNNGGIRITSSNNNELYDNLIISNNGGLRLCCFSKNNTIFKNTFINNTDWNAIDNVSNQWDNGIIGNYWDDYIEKYPEAKKIDDIWDTPYIITDDIVDRYPLVNLSDF